MQRYSLIPLLFLPHANFFRSNRMPLLPQHFPTPSLNLLHHCSLWRRSKPPPCRVLSLAPCSPSLLSSQPLPENGQGRVEGELGLVGSAVSQQQGARLGPVACRQQLSGGFLHIPASLLLVGQHVRAEQGVQRGGDAVHQEPSIQEQGEELGVAGGSCLLVEKERRRWKHASGDKSREKYLLKHAKSNSQTFGKYTATLPGNWQTYSALNTYWLIKHWKWLVDLKLYRVQWSAKKTKQEAL